MLYRLLFIIVAVTVFAGCKQSENKTMLPAVAGTPGSLVIVIDKAEWDTKIGEELRSIFEQPFEVLPQYEPIFNVMHVPHAGLTTIVKSQRNVLMVNLSPSHKEPKILAQKNLWAEPQLVISMYAPDDSSFVNLIRQNKSKIVSLLEDMERKRLMDIFKGNLDGDIQKKIRKDFNIDLLVPKGYNIHIDSTDFMWLTNEFSDIILSLVIYQYNYTDTGTFTKDYLINKRNYYSKKFINGEVKGSYMTTETLYGPFLNDYMLRGETYVAEIRGLWKMEKGIAMGGPFVSITALDETRNKIITVEGFVYAAGHDKRNFLRQVEAIVLSSKLHTQKK